MLEIYLVWSFIISPFLKRRKPSSGRSSYWRSQPAEA